jgi:hypothetical protein
MGKCYSASTYGCDSITLPSLHAGMKCIKSTDIVDISLLVYDYSLTRSVMQIMTEKLQEAAIKQKIVRFQQSLHILLHLTSPIPF